MRDKSTIKGRIIALLTGTLFIVLMGEGFVRLFLPVPPVGFLMFSSPTFRLDTNNAVRYMENENIRAVTVYNGSIEYDVTFPTNNLGFIDHKDYIINETPNGTRQYYGFVGNSFTAGIDGGEPWVPKLRDKLESLGADTEIYNLGVGGTGIEHFYRLLNSVKGQIRLTHIVLLVISEDLRRKFWRPLVRQRQIRLCTETMDELTCAQRRPVARIIDYNSTSEELLTFARQIREQELFNPLRNSQLLRTGIRVMKSRWQRIRERQNYLRHLKRIKKLFSTREVYLIHLPQRKEVLNGTYEIDLEEHVVSIGIKYFPALRGCKWSKEMFYSNNKHPNSFGYRTISNCVGRYLSAGFFSRESPGERVLYLPTNGTLSVVTRRN